MAGAVAAERHSEDSQVATVFPVVVVMNFASELLLLLLPERVSLPKGWMDDPFSKAGSVSALVATNDRQSKRKLVMDLPQVDLTQWK